MLSDEGAGRKTIVRRRGAAAAIGCCLVGIVWMFRPEWDLRGSSSNSASSGYAKEIAAARQAGVPVTAAELQPPLPPREQNAARYYWEIGVRLISDPLIDQDAIVESLTGHEMASDEQFERVRRILKRRSALMELVHRAAGLESCVFKIDRSSPSSSQTNESTVILRAVRLLVAESLLAARDNQPLVAIRQLARGFTMGRHAAPESYLVGYTNAAAIDTMVLHALQRVLHIAGNKAEVADAVRVAIEQNWRPHSLAAALKDSAGTDIVNIEWLRARGPAFFNHFIGDNRSPQLRLEPREWNRLLDENGTLLLRQQRQMIAVADAPYVQAEPIMNAMNAAVDHDDDNRHALVLVLTDNYARFAVQEAMVQARADVTRISAAVLAWKDRYGSFPDRLDQVMNSLPLDPFDVNALRYRREGEGFVVFSVGQKRLFDGGAPNKRPAGLDVLFRYPFPRYYAGPLAEARIRYENRSSQNFGRPSQRDTP